MAGFDVVTLGELLIDFTSSGKSPQGNPLFEANPGGGVANCVAMLAKLGRKTAFIGSVGNEFLGRFLVDTLKELNINSVGMSYTDDANTTLAFVSNSESGERDFFFMRKPGADMMLKKSDLPVDVLTDTKIFHFGTISMTHPEVDEASKEAIRLAKESGALLTVDPNYRPMMWPTVERAKEKMKYAIEICDVLKISDNEIEFITGESDIDKGIDIIRGYSNAKLILATLGPDGSKAYYKDLTVFAEPFIREDTIETTGAGDAFTGSMLNAVLEYGIDGFDEDKLHRSLTFANAAASIITTRKGAMRVMPTEEEITSFIKERGRL